MNELIKVKVSKTGKQTVSARSLYEKLEITSKFNDWFKRMCDYGFEKGKDFSTVTQKKVTVQGNESTFFDYNLTIECAKEICMLQRSEIGRKFRQYFIACEKALLEHTETRNKSKTIRNNFTKTLSEHGYTKPYEYIQTTKQMKSALGINTPKNEMTDKELRLITASEYLADCVIDKEYGYHEVNPICVEASEDIAGFIEERKQNRIA